DSGVAGAQDGWPGTPAQAIELAARRGDILCEALPIGLQLRQCCLSPDGGGARIARPSAADSHDRRFAQVKVYRHVQHDLAIRRPLRWDRQPPRQAQNMACFVLESPVVMLALN